MNNNPNGTDELNLLGYNSSAPDLVEDDVPTPQDEADVPTLKQIQVVFKKRKAFYNSNAALTVNEEDFTIKQQLAVTQAMVREISNLESLVLTTINKVKEKQGERY